MPLAAAEEQDPEIQDVIGVSGPDLGVQTWQTAFTNPGMDPTFPQDGLNYLYPPLAAAPDGHLDAIESEPSINRIWDLLSVTLPDQPVMHPATVRLLHARASASGRRFGVRLSCSGQAGRVCDGTISVKHHARTIARQTYGLAPGLQSTHTLMLPSTAAVTGVSVTTVDPLAHEIQTQSLQLP